MKKLLNYGLLLLFTFSLTQNSYSQTMKRNEIDNKYKWDLSVLYKSVDKWHQHRKELSEKVNSINDFEGKLGKDSETLYKALNNYFGILKGYYKLAVYASRLSDEDLNIGANQELTQQVSSLGTKISEASSYINPEILKIDTEKINTFLKENEKLADYKFFIKDIQRLKEHTLSQKEEQILASAGMLAGTQSTVYSIFNNSEKVYPKVTLEDGKEVELNSSNYVRYRATQNRNDRAKVFKAFFEDGYGQYKNTLGANLAAKVKTDYFFAKNRKYDTALESSLDANNIPVSVYKTLINQINKNLPTLHRALDLKKRMLGVDELHYYDLYTSMVKDVDMVFNVDEAQELLLKVFEPMGDEYVSTVKKSFEDRWIDYYPSKGKRSGAYSSGAAYDFHPYILMNFTDDYESVSTLAHELGHTMHSYFSNKHQPFVNSGYATFVAEIASTMNENLLNTYMVDKVETDEEKLYLLGSYLELLRTTIFRQVSFAEFEWKIHERIENNEPLTGEVMSNIYYDIVKRYYGHDKGHCVVDPYIQYEWSYIPHFLGYSYYVYQYSTSLIYATAFAEKVLQEGEPAVEKYYNILKGGGSEYPIELIKKAGLDPMSPEAFDLTMAKMNKVMDQIEEILNKK